MNCGAESSNGLLFKSSKGVSYCSQPKQHSLLLLRVLLAVIVFIGVDAAILRTGNPLQWPQSKPFLNHVRLSGVKQFLNHYVRCVGIEMPMFLWGDEIEYGVFQKSQLTATEATGTGASGYFDLYLNATNVRETLAAAEKQLLELPVGCEWQPEYGSWMVEAVPRNPYGSYVSDLMNVEKSMKLRRKRLDEQLKRLETSDSSSRSSVRLIAPTVSNFPMLGAQMGDSYAHTAPARGPIANSAYLSDAVINPFVRFGALTRNIRLRRGSNVNILVPKDRNSSDSSDIINSSGDKLADDYIHMDAMAFGMGCCCLQVTMQSQSEDESRFLHDQLAVLSPILQALSAATPIHKGSLAATDTRWNVIAQAVDDRTAAEEGRACDSQKRSMESGEIIRIKGTSGTATSSSTNDIDSIAADVAACRDAAMAGEGIRPLNQSRYSAIALFIGRARDADELEAIEALNDLEGVSIDDDAYQLLRQRMDKTLARHIAHLFVRDPLVIFDDLIFIDDESSMDHFENIQSTNWRSMRWKPPSLRVGIEFNRRQAEQQLKQHQQNNSSIYHHQQEQPVSEEMDAAFHNDWNSDSDVDFDRNILVEDRYYTDSVQDDSLLENLVDSAIKHAEAGPARYLDVAMANNDGSSSSSSSNISRGDSELQLGLQSFGPGWRIEFRPLEVQLTDFENAAFAMIVVLLSRALLRDGHNFYIPMSLVHENMRRAQLKNAATTQKFWFRTNCFSDERSNHRSAAAATASPPVTEAVQQQLLSDCEQIARMQQRSTAAIISNSDRNDSTAATATILIDCADSGAYNTNSGAKAPFAFPKHGDIDLAELTLDEIMNGQQAQAATGTTVPFRGLLPAVVEYISSLGCDDTTVVFKALQPYLQLLGDRAAGRLPTTARYIRDFIADFRAQHSAGTNVTHSSISNSSIVDSTQLIPEEADALLEHCYAIGTGSVQCAALYGEQHASTVKPLALIDEEDLMYSNHSCFLRRVLIDQSLRSDGTTSIANDIAAGINNTSSGSGATTSNTIKSSYGVDSVL